MALSNSRVAWVNRSNTNIPVYEKLYQARFIPVELQWAVHKWE